MKAYKGFDQNLCCRGFQYEIGKTYETDKAELCKSGFHACLNPCDCFGYYPPANSRFCEVDVDGDIKESCESDVDTKVCGKKITIVRELTVKGMAAAAKEFVSKQAKTKEIGGGYQSALVSGDQSALTGGYQSALVSGRWSALVGGGCSALTSGDWSALTSGDQSALTGGYRSALVGGYRSILTGGDLSVVYGGDKAKVRGGIGSVLAIQYWRDGEFVGVKAKVVDGVKIKADTWYTLNSRGAFVEVKEREAE